MRSLGGDEPRTRRPLALSSSEEDFQLGRISTRDDGAREYERYGILGGGWWITPA